MGACCGKEKPPGIGETPKNSKKSASVSAKASTQTGAAPGNEANVNAAGNADPVNKPPVPLDTNKNVDNKGTPTLTPTLTVGTSDQVSATAAHDHDADGHSFAATPAGTEQDTPSMTLEPEHKTGSADADTLNIGARVTLDPKSRFVQGHASKSARKARKSMEKDVSGAKADKRRRQSVHETIYKLGGFIMDRKTGKQVYIEPNTPFEKSSEDNRSADGQSSEK